MKFSTLTPFFRKRKIVEQHKGFLVNRAGMSATQDPDAESKTKKYPQGPVNMHTLAA